MRNLSAALVDAFKSAILQSGADGPPVTDALKWLRYYLDFCAKYDEPPRDPESLGPFLQKLASKQQTPEQQKQAAVSVQAYYGLMSDWTETDPSGQKIVSADSPWTRCYENLKNEIRLRHYSRSTLKTYRGWVRQFERWLPKKNPNALNSADARAFLTHLAVDRHVAASTQNQTFNALLFFYKHTDERYRYSRHCC